MSQRYRNGHLYSEDKSSLIEYYETFLIDLIRNLSQVGNSAAKGVNAEDQIFDLISHISKRTLYSTGHRQRIDRNLKLGIGNAVRTTVVAQRM